MRSDRRGRQRRRCRRIVDRLDLPSPFDAADFIGALARLRGRPIELIPVRSETDIPCGVLITTDRADYIVYAADTTPLHQQHILLHEAAHVICGHYETAPASSAAARVLLPDLPPALVRRVLSRSVYTEPQEQEAELVASLILTRAAHLARTGPTGPEWPRLRTLFGGAGNQEPTGENQSVDGLDGADG
ncbi:ParH-like protein [Streptomyces sp. NPDC006285]|uniref:ParH-like protein n=1 Tax=Streptomyces sp. NPDC006285 TaxID=3364742 RepID=UPI0036BCB985